MAGGKENGAEIQATNGATEASKRFLARRAFWNTAEVTHDATRYATLPIRLAGNIVKDTLKAIEETTDGSPGYSLFSALLLAGYEGTLGIFAGPKLIETGIDNFASSPLVGGALVATGAILELPNAAFAVAGVGQGIADTYNHTVEKNQKLREKRAARRASWQ